MPVKSKLFDTTLWYKILPIMSILAKCKLMWMFELQNYLGCCKIIWGMICSLTGGGK